MKIVINKKDKKNRKSFFGDNAGAVASITQNQDDPNTNYSDHIINFYDLELTKSNIGLCVDVSGSNNRLGGEWMLKQLLYCKSIDNIVNIRIQTFGDSGPITDYYTEDKISLYGTWHNLYNDWQACNRRLQRGDLDRNEYLMEQYKSFSDFSLKYYDKSHFNTATDTFSLNNFIKNSHKENIDTIYIIGDGQFGGRYTNNIEETKRFLDNLEQCDFSKLKRLIILFCNHTTNQTELLLTRDILTILEKCQNAIEFKTIHLPLNTESYIKDMILENNKSYITPKDHIVISGIISFHKKLTDQSMINYLSKDIPKVKKLYDYIKGIITCKPQLLLEKSEDNILCRIHTWLKGIMREEYKDEISLLKNNAILEGRIEIAYAITKLLDMSFNKSEDIKRIVELTKKFCIGYYQLPDNININPELVLDAIRDGSNIKMANFVKKVIGRGIFIPRKKSEDVDVNKGMLIMQPIGKVIDKTNLDKTSNENRKEYYKLLRMALQTFFCQFGSFLIQGKKTFIMGLCILQNEATIPRPVYNMIYNAIYNDPEYTCRMLEFNPKLENSELDINDSFCAPTVMEILANSLLYKSNIMFKDYLKDEKMNANIQELRERFRSFLRVLYIKKTYKNMIKMKKTNVTRQISEIKKGQEINVGDMCLVAPYKNEPQKNIPAVIIILSKQETSKSKFMYLCEYLDKPRGIKDTWNISGKNLKIIAKNPNDTVVKEVNDRLIKLHTEGRAGKYGPKYLADAQLDQELRESEDKKITDIIEKHKCVSVEYVKRNINIGLSNDDIIDIMRSIFHLNDKFYRFLKSDANINKENYLKFSEPCLDELKLKDTYNVIYKGNEYPLTKNEIKSIVKKFNKEIASFKPSFTETSNYEECPICYVSTHIKEMVPFKKCLHKVCKHCSNKYKEMRNYSGGSVVKPYYHKCTICSICDTSDTPALTPHFAKYTDDSTGCLCIPTKVKFKYCIKCIQPFECQLACNNDETSLRDVCESCNICQDAVICPNPDCNLPIQRTEGCDHMACICGWHWCYKCRFVITGPVLEYIDTIDWSCHDKCTQNTCDKYLVQCEYYP